MHHNNFQLIDTLVPKNTTVDYYNPFGTLLHRLIIKLILT